MAVTKMHSGVKLTLRSDGWYAELNETPKVKPTSVNVALDSTDENLYTFAQAYATLWGDSHPLVEIIRVDSNTLIG